MVSGFHVNNAEKPHPNPTMSLSHYSFFRNINYCHGHKWLPNKILKAAIGAYAGIQNIEMPRFEGGEGFFDKVIKP
jgi:hypothetical protein